ncbi:MAG TPA: class I SAM-dependent methyltransferase [Chloroflexia bacterium]|nr:class I SAM-dependent methyltransferase [Chloroflexia bacterium]
MVATPMVDTPETAAQRAPGGCPHPEGRQKALFTARDYISGDLFVLRRCGACGLVRTSPPPPGDEIGRYYPQGYYGRGKRYSLPLERLLDWLYAFRGRLIEMANGLESGRVLDIGCGRGLLLHQLRKRGWEVAGTELSEDSARYARDVLQIDVKTANIHDLDYPAEEFDTVILWHVLEHITDPAGLLREVTRILRPGGTLLVAVPNFASVEARLARAHWFHLDVPRHLSHFTPAVLRALLQEAGLRPRMVSYFASEYDFFSFVQTALNMLGIRHNLLYNLLRTRGAKVLDGPRQTPAHPVDLALTLTLAPLLGALSLVWAPLIALLGRGATVTIYAKKPRR